MSKNQRSFWLSAGLALAGGVCMAQGVMQFRVELAGRQEVPAVSTAARGEFRATVYDDNSALTYELSYSGLEGNALQAHIHLGQHGVNGGVAVWLCSNLASPPTPAGVQPCPAQAGTVTGTVTAADVVGPAGQGLAPGEFAELLVAMRQGLTYVNVHSSLVPGGEIRSQIGAGRSAGQ